MYQKAYRFAVDRHPNKGKWWVVNRYFMRGGDRWVFSDPQSKATLLKFSHTKVVRHVIAQGYSSPDDAQLAAYWENRRKARYSHLSAKHRQLAAVQDWECPVCGEPLENGEVLRIHYVNSLQRDGHDKPDTRVLMHLFCHQQMQSQRRSESVTRPTTVSKSMKWPSDSVAAWRSATWSSAPWTASTSAVSSGRP